MSIREFPLAWRWTDLRHAVLPDEVLAKMRPVIDSGAPATGPGRWTDASFRVDQNTDAVRSWLREQQPKLDEVVTIEWSVGCAVQTTWDVFTKYWDDFCYPSSDDVLIWAADDIWRLAYHHDEVFTFSKPA